jgi:hypothetical protein
LARTADLIHWPQSGGPAFLLDARRTSSLRSPAATFFDNRWMVTAEDFPSGDKLKANDITKCYVISEHQSLAHDLKKILLAWQNKGIEIYLWKNLGFEKQQLAAPSWIERAGNFFMTINTPSPNSDGGFGKIVQGSGG